MVRKDFQCDWCGEIAKDLIVPSSVSQMGCTKEGCPGVMNVIITSVPYTSIAATPSRNPLLRNTTIHTGNKK